MTEILPRRSGSTSLMVIGIDGGTWQVLKPLLDAGLLEHLGSILQEGTESTLNSIIPPVTGPAWPVLATGLNPGRLGTYDFYNRRSLDDYNLYPVRSHWIRGTTLWDVLSARGYRVGVFNYPMLVPTYRINGWMVSGLGASKAQDWVWPRDLGRELDRVAQPYQISLSWSQSKYRNNYSVLLEDLETMLTNRVAALEFLLDRHPVDVLIAVLSVSDFLSHTLWHLWDEQHPISDRLLNEKLWPRVSAIWSKLDLSIAQIAEHLDPSGNLLMVSDHGFGPSFGVFHVNTWLEKQGYLKRQRQQSHLGNHVRAHLVSALTPVLGPVFSKMQGSPAHFALRESILREIDLAETRAFALETTDVCGMIFVNREYARRHDLDEASYVRSLTAEIRKGLEHAGQDMGLEVETFSSGELYTGEFTELAPDILFKVNDFAVSVSPKFAPVVYEPRLYQPMKTGNHRQQGIFVGAGAKIRKGLKLDGLDILDIAPTAYQLLGEALPTHLDGHVAKEILLPQFQGVVSANEPAFQGMPLDRGGFDSIEEAREMQQRLRELGYLD